jgi:diadenosine tetraphosphatase ApaH/serine/threonine PP2A family protein phosphatase
MRILIISDIHANLTALEAVLSDAGEHDATWCLGDLVGYGPDPNQCVQRIRDLPNLLCLIGNHDAAALDLIDISSFNPEAQLAVIWTHKQLTPANADYLLSLPERITTDQVSLAHGSPRYPIWEYLLDTRTATQNFSHFETPFCFVGHSHLPIIFQKNTSHHDAELIVPATPCLVPMSPRAIFNPGSVGQPRDRDPRAAYAIYDSDALSWEYRRVTYDIQSVQARMVAANLPDRHIQRLSSGW